MEFGFSMHHDLLVDHDRWEPVLHEIVKRVPSVASCIACGTCMGTCTAAEKTGMGFRKMLTYMRTGSRKELTRALSYCQLCGKCWLSCPRGVNTRKAILEMKDQLEVSKYFAL